MSRPIDAVLLIAFGGPTSPDEVRPFLANITSGRPIPEARLEAVAHHYELIGGASPFNALTFRQAGALQGELARRGARVPVFVGMRSWRPFLRDVLAEMAAGGHRRVFGIILAAQQTEASWGRYQESVRQALAAVAPAAIEVVYAPAWHDHTLFLEAVTDTVAGALAEFPADTRPGVHIIFTAHSVPVPMAQRSPYVAQIEAGAHEVARRLRHGRWSVAFQSRSGNPAEPWLEPDVNDAIRGLASGGTRDIVVAPLGFVCDHVEVLYDLDIEARQTAERLGCRFVRAPALNDHPLFIRMLADLVCDARRAAV